MLLSKLTCCLLEHPNTFGREREKPDLLIRTAYGFPAKSMSNHKCKRGERQGHFQARQSVTPGCLKGQARTKQSHGLHGSSTIFLLISPVTPKGQLGLSRSGMLLNIVLFWTALLKMFLLSVFQKKKKRIFPPLDFRGLPHSHLGTHF